MPFLQEECLDEIRQVVFLFFHHRLGRDAPDQFVCGSYWHLRDACVSGLKESVEILKDRWGISHIYAKNESDLFFAQGYNVARDRLFQPP
jgi:acyl-homoserine lactone acylase PvdQ